jgi:hypothetical protein
VTPAFLRIDLLCSPQPAMLLPFSPRVLWFPLALPPHLLWFRHLPRCLWCHPFSHPLIQSQDQYYEMFF